MKTTIVARKMDLTAGMKMWKEKLSEGSATTEEFLEWLAQFK